MPDLSAPEAAALDAAGVGTVTPSAVGGWTIRTGSTVGVIRVGELEVRVQPKVAVERLLYLLSYAGQEGWRQDDVAFADAADHVDALAYAFTSLAERALRRGVLQGYVTREEASPVLRGRLRTGDQLASRFGLPFPVEVTFDEYTPDIPENQLLVAAASRVLRTGGLPQLRRRLRHLLANLEGVSSWPTGLALPTIRPTRLNGRYQPALALARLILEGASFRFAAGGIEATGLLFNMNRVFEDFLGRTLRDALERRLGTVELQHISGLDEAGMVEVRPDITWWDRGRCRAVIDAKYKELRSDGPPSGDLFQLLAYCTAYGLRTGHLVYAGASSPVMAGYSIRNSDVILHVHVLDLDRPPLTLLSDVETLAGCIHNDMSAALVSY